MKKYLYLILIFIISFHKPYESVSVNLNVSQGPRVENWGIQAKNLITIWWKGYEAAYRIAGGIF